MKLLFQNYTFNAAAKQIIFNTTDTVELENVLLITNVKSNQIIYNFANPSQGGTISNNVLTLTYDTTLMSNADSLQIFLDLGGTPASDDSIILLRRLVQILQPLATQDSAQRQRVVVDTGAVTVSQGTAANLQATVTGTVTANQGGTWNIGTTTTVNQLAGVDSRFQIIDWARTAYNTGIRSNLLNS